MSLTIPGLGGRVSAWHRQRPQQSSSGSGPPGAVSSESTSADEVSTSLEAGQSGRSEIAGIYQAIQSTEESLALLATARHGLEAVHHRLGRMCLSLRQALDCARDGVPDPHAWEGTLKALRADAQAIDRLAQGTGFGGATLLDGSFGCRGAAFGHWIEFVRAGDRVRSSPPEGYQVVLTQEPTRATILGAVALSAEQIASGEMLELEADGESAAVTTRPGQHVLDIVSALQQQADFAGLPLGVLCTRDDRLLVHHRRYGRTWRFRVRSRTAGVLSTLAGKFQEVSNGRDAAGTIHGEPAEGEGQLLIGSDENRNTAGLVIRYLGTPPPGFEPPEARSRALGAAPSDGWKDGCLEAGRVIVVQRALVLRLNANEAHSLRLDSVACTHLGCGAREEHTKETVADVLQSNPEHAERALRILEKARSEIGTTLNTALHYERVVLTEHLGQLRVEVQNLLSSQSPDSNPLDLRVSMALLGQQFRNEGQTALAAQRYPRPTTMLKLLISDEDKERELNWQV